jgi:hypothetical protein
LSHTVDDKRIINQLKLVESVKIGQSVIFNGWFVFRRWISNVFVNGVMLLLMELKVILLLMVPLNQADQQFLMDDMF